MIKQKGAEDMEKTEKDINQQLGTSEVVWRLEDLFASPDDAAIRKIMDHSLESARRLREEYAGRVADLSASELKAVVESLENLSEELAKIGAFAYLNFSTNAEDPEAGAFLQKVREFGSQVEKELVFFELEWAKVEDERAEQLLDQPVLAHFRHYLTAMRRYRPHLLSEIEERLLIELSPVGRSSWVNLFDKVLAFHRYGERKRTQEEVLTDLYNPDRQIRKKAASELTEGLRKDLHIVTHTFNTVLADKMIQDRLRSYPKWISSMNLANELDDETVDTLIHSVTSNYATVERYYSLKRDILGMDQLYDYDRYAPLPWLPDRKVEWKQAREMVIDAYSRFSPEMAAIAERFFMDSWIHAPVVPGKVSGAFAHPVAPSVHPYVLLNYTGTLRDVETLAHELGHGVHQVLAARQGLFNSDTPLTLAETASVFGEMLVFQDILATLNDPRERLGFLCSKIESIFATVFRQIAMNRFEDAIHNRRREQGELSSEEFSVFWMNTQREMFGESVTLTDDYGIWWSYISHFLHVPGYVYAYAFGELLVLSLYATYQEEGDDFVKNYMELLASGGSRTPYELMKPFGIDLRDENFWLQGLHIIDKMVQDAQTLYEQEVIGR